MLGNNQQKLRELSGDWEMSGRPLALTEGVCGPN